MSEVELHDGGRPQGLSGLGRQGRSLGVTWRVVPSLPREPGLSGGRGFRRMRGSVAVRNAGAARSRCGSPGVARSRCAVGRRLVPAGWRGGCGPGGGVGDVTHLVSRFVGTVLQTAELNDSFGA
jgi:hypothetical protein